MKIDEPAFTLAVQGSVRFNKDAGVTLSAGRITTTQMVVAILLMVAAAGAIGMIRSQEQGRHPSGLPFIFCAIFGQIARSLRQKPFNLPKNRANRHQTQAQGQ